MDSGAILLLLAVIVLIGVFVSRPLLQPIKRVQETSQQDHEKSALLAERDRLISTVQELEFDHMLGKITDDEFAPQRQALMAKGADLLRQMDALQPASRPVEDVEQRVEAAVAHRRAVAALPAEDDALEKLISARRSTRNEKSAGFCPGCGKPVQKSDKFCPRCGSALG